MSSAVTSEPEAVPVPAPPRERKYNDALSAVCMELQKLQRRRAAFIKSRIVAENNCLHTVATLRGYYAGLPPEERERHFKEATELVKVVREEWDYAGNTWVKGAKHAADPAAAFIVAAGHGVRALEVAQANIEKKEMLPLAKKLPLADWIKQDEQAGVSLLYLAVIVGETDDFREYANPGKLWRRLGCAPWTYNGKTLMGSTWKSGLEGKLPASEWEAFGYSPRRRSISFLIGQNLKMQNHGVYRARYDTKKEDYARKHPDKVRCVCAGSGKKPNGKSCPECLGKGRRMMRADRHGMLLATKLFLKNAWKEWVKLAGAPEMDVGEFDERAK